MIHFVTGYAIVFGALCGVALSVPGQVQGIALFGAGVEAWQSITVLLFVLPVVTAWITLDTLNRVSRRRWFDYRLRKRARLLCFGVSAGLVGATECTLLLAWGEDFFPAWVIVPLCTVLAAAGAFMLIPAVRPGVCLFCGYDLRDGGLDGRCTECGSLDPL